MGFLKTCRTELIGTEAGLQIQQRPVETGRYLKRKLLIAQHLPLVLQGL